METQQQTSSASLSREEVKTLGLSSLGGILEFYDFIIVFFSWIFQNPVQTPPEPWFMRANFF